MDYVECDVRSSSDDVIILIHDFSLERLAQQTGSVTEKSFSELRTLEIGDGEKIPTLTEFLELVAPHEGLSINLDVKVVNVEAKILESIEEFKLLDRTMISSFIQPVLTTFRKLDDEIATALLYEYNLRNPKSQAVQSPMLVIRS